MNPIILARLIDNYNDIFASLDGSGLMIAEVGGSIRRILCMNACEDKDRAPILRNVPTIENVDEIATFDKATKTVWLIPSELLEARTIIRLGKKYEDFIIPEPTSLTFEEQKRKRKDLLSTLLTQARNVGEKIGRGGD